MSNRLRKDRGTDPDLAASGGGSRNTLVQGRRIDIAGVPVTVQALDPARAAVMDYLEDNEPSSRPARLSVFFGDEVSLPPRRPPDESNGKFKIWRDGRILHTCYGEDVSATASRRSITIGVRRPELYPAFNYFFPLTVAHSLAFHKRLVLRGGALYRSNQAMLILGGQGAGKSTTVWAGLKAGWRPVSDDSVVLGRRKGALTISGIIKDFLVPGDVLPNSQEEARAIPGDSRQRWVLANPGWGHGSHELCGTVVVHHGDVDHPELQLLPKNALREAVVAALPASMSLESEKSAAWKVMRLVSAISDLPAWSLPLSPNPARRLAEASRLLDNAASSLGTASRG